MYWEETDPGTLGVKFDTGPPADDKRTKLMKRWPRIALCILLAGCFMERKSAPDAGQAAAGPLRLTEQEPNDRPEQAQSISQSSIVSAGLSANPSNPDEDWYLLAPPSPKVVDLTVSGIPGADVAIEIYDTDRNRLVAVNSEGEGKPERIPNLGVKTRLLVKVFSAKRGAGGAYTQYYLWNYTSHEYAVRDREQSYRSYALRSSCFASSASPSRSAASSNIRTSSPAACASA